MPESVQGGRLFPRRFALVRSVGYTGISGTGVVAYGVKFSDGQVVLRWLSEHPATSMWNSMDDMIAVHSPDATDVQWIDQPGDCFEELASQSEGKRRRSRRPPSTGSKGEWPVANGDPLATRPMPPPRPDPPETTDPEPGNPRTNGRSDASGLFGAIPPAPRPAPAARRPGRHRRAGASGQIETSDQTGSADNGLSDRT